MIIFYRANLIFAIGLECCFQFSVSQYRSIADFIERVLQRDTKMIGGLSCEKKLGELELFNLEKTLGEISSMCIDTSLEEMKRKETDFLSSPLWEDKRQWTKIEKQENQSEN